MLQYSIGLTSIFFKWYERFVCT